MFTIRPKNNLNELPPHLQPEKLCQRENDRVLAWFGQGSRLSNFSESPFKVDNTEYKWNEQFIGAGKATLFNDDVTREKIMKAKSPAVVKALSSRVKNFIPQKWEQECGKIAFKGALAKFEQNADHANVLLATGNKELAEATRDKTWGVGLSLSDPGLLDPTHWTGANVMGNALMKVRDTLRSRISSASTSSLDDSVFETQRPEPRVANEVPPDFAY